ncbi:MAG: sulfite exporter TauE/SafE family protein [Candidatus Sericytochromatia bacterium]
MLDILGYISGLFIGGTLGVFGGGGSILTVPVLVYLFKISPVVATAYSLFIVGITSLVGAISRIKQKEADIKVAISFAIPGLTGVFLTRKYIIPAIPEKIYLFNDLVLTKDTAILIFFSIIMLLASISMIKGRKENTNTKKLDEPWNTFLIIIGSFTTGIITGIVGAGGGFLIIPALVFLAKLDIKQAVATSVLIIAINSLVGFTGNLNTGIEMNFKFLIGFSLITIFGILIGIKVSNKIPANKLKPAFGWFIMIMGIFIILKETIL